MTQQESNQLQKIACEIRKGIINTTHAAKSGHPGGSLGATEIFTMLYFKEMNIDPNNPKMQDRDRFVLSKGHCAPGLYSTLANRGYFPVKDLLTLRHNGSYLQGHPNMDTVPGVDMSTGSLGQGVSAAAGMALGAKINNQSNRVYALLGDGEIEEGQCWEAFMFSSHYKLDNFCVIIDVNGLQIDGKTKDVMNAEPIDEKMRAFGFEVLRIDGNSFDALEKAFSHARKIKGKPTCIVADTLKGKDVSFMENQASWHGKAPNDEQAEQALEELEKVQQALEGM